MLEVRKQNRETSQSLVKRFGQKIQRSGILLKARQNRFHSRPKSKKAIRERALRREELRKEYRRLNKLGQLPVKGRR